MFKYVQKCKVSINLNKRMQNGQVYDGGQRRGEQKRDRQIEWRPLALVNPTHALTERGERQGGRETLQKDNFVITTFILLFSLVHFHIDTIAFSFTSFFAVFAHAFLFCFTLPSYHVYPALLSALSCLACTTPPIDITPFLSPFLSHLSPVFSLLFLSYLSEQGRGRGYAVLHLVREDNAGNAIQRRVPLLCVHAVVRSPSSSHYSKSTLHHYKALRYASLHIEWEESTRPYFSLHHSSFLSSSLTLDGQRPLHDICNVL
mmetsp:Transcript_35399/g.92135  ORF Transcript_35399/g.92135 Transcript_35399/m.92135 type:complete len:260 (+) Transcript_35399:1940-2719(+)